ncbi:MAG: hypothetical protein Q8M40_02835 [Legionella sp.]|nr:hypothetical protein [Legionella sp.]
MKSTWFHTLKDGGPLKKLNIQKIMLCQGEVAPGCLFNPNSAKDPRGAVFTGAGVARVGKIERKIGQVCGVKYG